MFEPKDLTPLTDTECPLAWYGIMKQEYHGFSGFGELTCKHRDPQEGATCCIRTINHQGPHVNHWMIWTKEYQVKLW